MKRLSLNDSFESYIYYSLDGCWYWLGALSDAGYARFRSRIGSRVSYELYNGLIPAGLWVLHSCDNPACVNPNHLFLGTQEDNVRDMIKKGRAVFRARVEVCKRGHPFINPVVNKKGRYCRVKKGIVPKLPEVSNG